MSRRRKWANGAESSITVSVHLNICVISYTQSRILVRFFAQHFIERSSSDYRANSWSPCGNAAAPLVSYLYCIAVRRPISNSLCRVIASFRRFLLLRGLHSTNLILGSYRLSLGSRFRDHYPIAPGFNHEVVMPTTSSFSYGHIALFPSCSHGSEAVGYYRETSVMVEICEIGG